LHERQHPVEARSRLGEWAKKRDPIRGGHRTVRRRGSRPRV